MKSCDKRRRKNKNLLSKKKYILIKCIIVLSAISISALSVYGAIKLRFNISTETWKVINSVKNFIHEIYLFGDGIVEGIIDIKSNINQVNQIFIYEIASNETNDNFEVMTPFYLI